MPIGAKQAPAILRCWIPKGMPMIVMKQKIALITWAIHNQIPAKITQIIFPIRPNPPVPISSFCVSFFLEITSFPKGKKQNWPITKHAFAQGIVIIKMI